MIAVLASIPSPDSAAIHIGSLQLRAYGFMIALGVVAGSWLIGRRLEARKLGTRDDAGSILTWGVIAGVIGARLYHVVTDWERFHHHLSHIPKIWEGGLGIPGGLMAGIPVGLWRARKRGISSRDMATVAAPAIPLAQAIGRWGNWWNQELFGRPTRLPWALEIDDQHLQSQGLERYIGQNFHPTFLYESLGNFILCGILLLIDRRRNPRPGRLMAMYLMGYALLRLGVESLRIDPAHEILGLRVNTWMSMIVFVGAATWLYWDSGRRPAVEDEPPTDEPVATDEPSDVKPVATDDPSDVEPSDVEVDALATGTAEQGTEESSARGEAAPE